MLAGGPPGPALSLQQTALDKEATSVSAEHPLTEGVAALNTDWAEGQHQGATH